MPARPPRRGRGGMPRVDPPRAGPAAGGYGPGMSVLSVDPAPAKPAVVCDGAGYRRVPAADLPDWCADLAERGAALPD